MIGLHALIKYVRSHIYMCRFVKGGNRKISEDAFVFMLLATNEKIYCERLDVSVKGTCSATLCEACKDVCYAVPPQRMYDSVRFGRLIRTIAIRYCPDELFAELDRQLSHVRTKNPLIRLNEAGEIENDEQLLFWARLATRHPEARFWNYTKNYDVLERCVEYIPNNLTINVSIWREQGVECFNRLKSHRNIKAYVVDNDEFACSTNCDAYITGHLDDTIKCGKNCFKCILPSPRTQTIRCREH